MRRIDLIRQQPGRRSQVQFVLLSTPAVRTTLIEDIYLAEPVQFFVWDEVQQQLVQQMPWERGLHG